MVRAVHGGHDDAVDLVLADHLFELLGRVLRQILLEPKLFAQLTVPVGHAGWVAVAQGNQLAVFGEKSLHKASANMPQRPPVPTRA